MACAASRCTMGERRASPNFLASASNSSFTCFFNLAFEPRIILILSRSFASSSCSPRIFISSKRASCLSLVSRMYSVCSSLSLKRFINTGLGSSSVRIMRITSSRFKNAVKKPSSKCSRRSTFSRRWFRRLRTVLVRKLSHSFKMVFRFLTCGRPSTPMMFMLTRKLFSRSVVANKCPINASTSTRFERGIKTRRTGFS